MALRTSETPATGALEKPIWLVGFRPFFTLAFLSGAILPLIWIMAFTGKISFPANGLSGLQWHAHEMLYGFGWAVMGGFLLTASKNWVKVQGMHGMPLALAVLFWIVERVAVFALPAQAPALVRFVLLNIFLLYVISYIAYTLVRYRTQDTFKDNYFFLIALPLFLVAKNLLLSATMFDYGVTMSIGLFRLAFAVMFERTMTQFMKNSMSITLYRNPKLDFSIKALVLLAAFESFLPPDLATFVLVLAATLLLVRFCLWKPLLGLRQFGIALMYVGYLALTLHLYLEALRISDIFSGFGTLSIHVFTLLCMGIVIPGMLIRISQGHTGRKLVFTISDRWAIGFMGVAAFFRVVATQVWPIQYTTWITLAGVGWATCFVILGVRLTPFLFQPRVDGRVH